MAKTKAEWKAVILSAMGTESALSAVNSTSMVAEWNLWVDIMAFVAHTVDTLFDLFRTDVDNMIRATKPHTLKWYVTKALAYRHGADLPPDSDVYATDAPADPAMLVVKNAAALELAELNIVRIKAAKDNGAGVLQKLSTDERNGLDAYMKRVKDAGVRLQVTSDDGDDLLLTLEIHYDALILTATGERIDGTSTTPVQNAVDRYLSSLPFNALFITNELIDAVEATEGVEICHVVLAKARYAGLPYTDIPVEYTPDAGYLTIPEDGLSISYLAHAPLH